MFSSRQRAAFWLERVLVCVAVLYLCVHTLPKAWRTLNTDFPNYYMAARLVHEGYDTSRMYEWTWLEREKDHRGVDDRVIGLLPITPFSTPWPCVADCGVGNRWRRSMCGLCSIFCC